MRLRRTNVLSCSSFCHAPEGGYRNISNALSIGTNIDRMSEGLEAAAQEKGLWDGSGTFSFSAAFAVDEDSAGGRKECGEKLLAELSKGGKLVVIVVSGVVMNLYSYDLYFLLYVSYIFFYS